MSVTSQTVYSGPYTPNGVTTEFGFDFKGAADDEVIVMRLLSGVWSTVSDGLYDVELADEDGGTVTFTTAPATGSGSLYIVSAPDFISNSNFGAEGPFSPGTLNTPFDRTVIRDLLLSAKLAALLPEGWFAAASRVGKFAGWDADGNPTFLSGSGADGALRADIAALNGINLVGSPEAGASFNTFRKRWRRHLEAQESVSQTAKVTMSVNSGEVGNDVLITAAAAHAGQVMYVMAANTKIEGVILDANTIVGAAWVPSAGIQTGGAIFATGVSTADRIAGLEISATIRNCDNGAINLEYTEDVEIGRLKLEDVQQLGAATITAGGLQVYYMRGLNAGDLSCEGYTRKAFEFGYLQRAQINSIRTLGGATGHSNLHFTGGEDIVVGAVIHDGDTGNGGGIKAVDARRLHFGSVVMYRADWGVQAYGSHMRVGWIESNDQISSALLCDAYQSREQSPTSEVDCVVMGNVRSVRGVSALTGASALVIRTDNTHLSEFTGDGVTVAFTVGTSPSSFTWVHSGSANLRAYVDGVEVSIFSVVGNLVTLTAAPTAGKKVVIKDITKLAPIRQVRIEGQLYARGGASASFTTPTPYGEMGDLYLGGIDCDDLDGGGYVAFNKAKNVSVGRAKGIKIGSNVRNGMIFYTDMFSRGGKCEVIGVYLATGSASWASEPVLRVGYPGAVQHSECGYESVIIEDWEVDGNGDATIKLIEVLCHSGDYIRSVAIRRIKGRNLVAAEQIKIDLTGCTDVNLVLEDIDIRNAAGDRLGITIVNPGAVTEGHIGGDVNATITGRPAKCNPLYATETYNPASIAGGALDAARTLTVTGARTGDRVWGMARAVDGVPNPIYGFEVVNVFVSAADTLSYQLMNMTAGAIDAANVTIDLFAEKRNVV